MLYLSTQLIDCETMCALVKGEIQISLLVSCQGKMTKHLPVIVEGKIYALSESTRSNFLGKG